MSPARAGRTVVLCPDPVGGAMSGMGIRYTEVACALRDRGPVVLAGSEVHGRAPEGIDCTTWSPDSPRGLRALLGDTDAVITPPQPPAVMRLLRRSGARLVFDLYDPETLEVLARFADSSSAVRRVHVTVATDKLLDALRSGHFLVCASERQRDLWLGALLGAHLLPPERYERDPSFRSVIDVVPFGLPSTRPERVPGAGARARFPSVGAEERIVLWNGGLWDWLDPVSAIRAVALLRDRGLPVKLIFMGKSAAGGDRAARAASAAAAEVDPDGRLVLFNDRWVPYDERASWLLDADCAISTHHDHLETRFAFRTRLLDCFWAGLPVVATAGDALADAIERHAVGRIAPPGDIGALAEGLADVLARPRSSYADGMRALARRHEWAQVVRPIAEFLRDPREAAPLGDGLLPALEVSPGRRLRRSAQALTALVRRARQRSD